MSSINNGLPVSMQWLLLDKETDDPKSNCTFVINSYSMAADEFAYYNNQCMMDMSTFYAIMRRLERPVQRIQLLNGTNLFDTPIWRRHFQEIDFDNSTNAGDYGAGQWIYQWIVNPMDIIGVGCL